MKEYRKRFLLVFGTTLLAGILLVGIFFGGAIFGLWGNMDGLDVEALTLRQNTALVYLDPKTGEEKELHSLSSEENREWADIDKIPQDLKDAFVSIEDERFYKHKGYDLPRTIKATMTWVGRKITGKSGATLGGSTITQQLVKNITGEREQVAARKIREISRAVALEKQLDKEQILELYLNCIYLSQGCNGVQTAAGIYFDKDVSELTLAECASLAGITQYPSLYDPFVNPEKNKERQKMVLGKMLELSYISQQEYDEAVNEPLTFATDSNKERNKGTGATSYFVDQVIRDVLRDLQAAGYSESLANKMVYSGGLKIYTTYVPQVQNAVEEYYENVKNFPDSKAQSAIAIIDVRTGQVAGIAGGIGEKTESLNLNRASMSVRQPGSSIKPIAVYAPAIEAKVITPGSIYQDEAKSYGNWTPRNSDRQYRGAVDIRRAVRSSLNTIAVAVLDDLGAKKSFDFLRNKMGITTLVEKRDINGTIYSDIGYSQLGLGGLTDGVTVLEMAAAYATFANEGIYNKPYIYTEVKDKEGNVILTADRHSHEAMSASTAFVMTRLLNEVVTSGTGGGAGLSNGIFTAGKTGTTDENTNRWFVGFTPYYSAAVWYGYDTPQEIAGGNPCVGTFRAVMNKAHQQLNERRSISTPSGVAYIDYCTVTGKRAGEHCPVEGYYFKSNNLPGQCTSEHEDLKTEEEGEEGAEGEDGEGTETPTPSATTGTTPPPPTSGTLEE
ncbi:MAG: PBP1A family penicillin-binding protein [Clostridia bacterium]|nr:PBP1A family penicillin-binding protein [Clostridia bacterium]